MVESGGFLAVPVFIKLWPLALVLLLIIYWPRQLLGRLAAVCLVLVLLPYLTRPPQIVAWQYREWYISLTGPLQRAGQATAMPGPCGRSFAA